MPDFYADHPFAEVVLKIANPEKFCAVGDIISGMMSGMARVEKFVDGGILVHPISAEEFAVGDVLVSPTASTTTFEIADVSVA